MQYLTDTLPEARAEIEKRFRSWGGSSASTSTSTPPAPTVQPSRTPTTICLIDKPGAAQSVIRIRHGGVERSSKVYYAIQVMNTLLGGAFSSRLNSNLRETKAYTYGASSSL